uniref:PARP catalytic domain-containing protein n=1 Tax=Arcella intermedia TaxID=1963864 RepID=A0A6B2KWM3_9EUKA
MVESEKEEKKVVEEEKQSVIEAQKVKEEREKALEERERELDRIQKEKEQREMEQREMEIKQLQMQKELEERERELERQRQIEKEKEWQRQKEMEERERELERQKQIEREKELQRQKEHEERERELERQKQIEKEKELQRQKELEERERELERQKQLEREKEIQRQKELEERERELEKKKQIEREKEQQIQKQRELLEEKERELERQRQIEKQSEIEKQKELKERERELEAMKQMEIQIQQQLREKEKNLEEREKELERQKLNEINRLKDLEKERDPEPEKLSELEKDNPIIPLEPKSTDTSEITISNEIELSPPSEHKPKPLSPSQQRSPEETKRPSSNAKRGQFAHEKGRPRVKSFEKKTQSLIQKEDKSADEKVEEAKTLSSSAIAPLESPRGPKDGIETSSKSPLDTRKSSKKIKKPNSPPTSKKRTSTKNIESPFAKSYKSPEKSDSTHKKKPSHRKSEIITKCGAAEGNCPICAKPFVQSDTASEEVSTIKKEVQELQKSLEERQKAISLKEEEISLLTSTMSQAKSSLEEKETQIAKLQFLISHKVPIEDETEHLKREIEERNRLEEKRRAREEGMKEEENRKLALLEERIKELEGAKNNPDAFQLLQRQIDDLREQIAKEREQNKIILIEKEKQDKIEELEFAKLHAEIKDLKIFKNLTANWIVDEQKEAQKVIEELNEKARKLDDKLTNPEHLEKKESIKGKKEVLQTTLKTETSQRKRGLKILENELKGFEELLLNKEKQLSRKKEMGKPPIRSASMDVVHNNLKRDLEALKIQMESLKKEGLLKTKEELNQRLKEQQKVKDQIIKNLSQQSKDIQNQIEDLEENEEDADEEINKLNDKQIELQNRSGIEERDADKIIALVNNCLDCIELILTDIATPNQNLKVPLLSVPALEVPRDTHVPDQVTKATDLSPRRPKQPPPEKKPEAIAKAQPITLLVIHLKGKSKMEVSVNSIPALKKKIAEKFSIKEEFSIEYHDDEFNEFLLLGNMEELGQKAQIRVSHHPRQPWQFTHSFSENPRWVTGGGPTTPYRSITIVENGKVLEGQEFLKLKGILRKCKTEKCGKIVDVIGISNEALERAFTFYSHALMEKFRSSPSIFKKEHWKTKADASQRVWCLSQFQKYAKKFKEWVPGDVPIIPVFHGTNMPVALKIAQTGFSTVATLDPGFYGRGIYFTTSLAYASLYSKGAKATSLCHIIVSLVSPGNVYPVIEHPKAENSLKGVAGPVNPGYQSHYACVGGLSSAGCGLPCPPSTKDFVDELVLFQDAQALPKYIISIENKL